MTGTDPEKTPSASTFVKRIPELDGLRGVAIILVIAFHYVFNQLTNPVGLFEKAVARITSFGWIGVDLFFVLSGFLIARILLRTKSSSRFFSTFYARRVVRIVPNYYLLISIFLLISSSSFFSRDYFLAQNNVVPGWAYLALLQNLFIARLQNFGNTSVSVTWSISIEEQFYLIFPLAIFFLNRRGLLWFLLLAIVAAPLCRIYSTNWIPAYVLLPCRMDAIAFGALIALLNESEEAATFLKKRETLIWTLLTLDILICLILFVKDGDLGFEKNTLFSLFFAICLLFALGYKDSYYARILRARWLGFIGTISYSLYLFHFFILGLFKYLAAVWSGATVEGAGQILVSVVALAFSIFFAWGIYQKFETPFVALGKKFKY